MDMIDFARSFNFVLAVLLTLLYLYQLGYLLIGVIQKKRTARISCAKLHRYAAVISARNEENVIASLIRSLKAQNYPSHLLDIYVIADNCTDNTAMAAKQAGAYVIRRFNQEKIGKGYALDYFFNILRSKKKDNYDGYFVFDADNYVDPDFVKEMNAVFDTGKYAAITSYRNSKNFGTNWISAGYGLWFLREARFLNFPRMLLGVSCAISGTGFLVSGKVIRENGGWPYHLLTEDIEFSVNCALKGQVIGYCDRAVIYDEQPITFRQSWDQRMRWSKGFYQVDIKYGLSLIKGCFSLNRKGFSCYDIFMTVAPGMLLTLCGILVNGIMLTACLTETSAIANTVVAECTGFIAQTILAFYLGLLVYGIVTTITEWKHIQIPSWKKIIYIFTFPIFMFTYVPIAAMALIRKVEWKPIYHGTDQKRLVSAGEKK